MDASKNATAARALKRNNGPVDLTTSTSAKRGKGDDGEPRHKEAQKKVAVVTTYSLKLSTVYDMRFERVVVDEATALRKPETELCRMITLIPKKTVILATATPTVAGRQDWR
ncbi:hypothetical protein GGR57DRAFT_426496 [Xylariaceae sp. FL1272]|nr:hypothetical protein GGR57DRAFT_426496 [Xylariaceae sp. FL1272]